jgi:hypothetical protein
LFLRNTVTEVEAVAALSIVDVEHDA